MTRRMIRALTQVQFYNRLGWQFKAEVEKKRCRFVKTENLRVQLGNIARLMYDSPKWGLFIRGSFGNGKTTAAYAIKHLINQLVNDRYFSDGEIFPWEWMDIVNAREMINLYLNDKGKFVEMKERQWLAIDDIGLDPAEVNVFGTMFYPFLELIDYRYERRLPTILVSNLKKEELLSHYRDERFADRFCEMFNATTFRDNTFRK